MGIFNSKSRKHSESEVDATSRLEIIAHKEATQKQVEAVRKANANLNQVLAKNGFTIKIYLAAGGRHPDDSKK